MLRENNIPFAIPVEPGVTRLLAHRVRFEPFTLTGPESRLRKDMRRLLSKEGLRPLTNYEAILFAELPDDEQRRFILEIPSLYSRIPQALLTPEMLAAALEKASLEFAERIRTRSARYWFDGFYRIACWTPRSMHTHRFR